MYGSLLSHSFVSCVQYKSFLPDSLHICRSLLTHIYVSLAYWFVYRSLLYIGYIGLFLHMYRSLFTHTLEGDSAGFEEEEEARP